MFKHSFNKFFPTPDFLATLSFGLDISDDSLKFVELISTKNDIRINKYGKRKIPSGTIESGKIINKEKIENLLLSLKKDYGIKFARVSIPENQVYLFKLILPKEGLVSIKEGIELSLEEHIPLPAPETIFDYELLSENEESLELEVAAISKNIIENYLSVFKNCGISVCSFELEAQAIARSVVPRGDMDTYMIVDFGEKSTCIFIISKGVVMFTSTLEIGGMVLNNMIQKNFKVNFEEADRMKKEYGLQRNTPNQEIFSVLLNSVSVLRDELVKHFTYWNTHKDEEGNGNPQIKKIILCGGDSNLTGLVDYLSISIKIKAEMANVWINVMDTEKHIPDMSFKHSLSFAAAVGLALGNFEDN